MHVFVVHARVCVRSVCSCSSIYIDVCLYGMEYVCVRTRDRERNTEKFIIYWPYLSVAGVCSQENKIQCKIQEK